MTGGYSPSAGEADLSRPGFILRLALLIGVGTGLGEVMLFAAQTHILHRFIFIGRDIVWMAPLAEAILFLGMALLLIGCGRISKRLSWLFAAQILGFFSFLALFLMYTPLHKGAALLLALGLAVQFGRIVRKHPQGFSRLVRQGSVALPALAIILGLLTRGSRWWEERNTVNALPAAAQGAPNVLLIILDTARALDLSVYGYGRPTSPALEQFARSAVRFDWAFSNAPWTLPSHASFFTGRFPHELSSGWLTPLDGKFPTLAESLAAHGYRTAGFVGNTLYCDTEKGLNRGFEHWEDYTFTPGELARSSVLIRELTSRRWAMEPINRYELLGRKSAGDVNHDFLQWLDGVKGRPFFTFLNYFDAHAPYLPGPDAVSRFATPGLSGDLGGGWARYRGKPKSDTLLTDWVQDNRDRYDAMLYQMDQDLGRLFAELERRGVLDNTIVIIAGDHGEQFGEHQVIGHGNSLYLPVLHVPLIIRYPRSVPAGRTISRAVSLRDLAATIQNLASIRDGVLPGRSLSRFWGPDSTSPAGGDTLLMEVDYNPRLPKGAPIDKGSMRAVILDTLHYIENGDKSEELYRYPQDPVEANDLAAALGDSTDLERHRAALKAIIPRTARAP